MLPFWPQFGAKQVVAKIKNTKSPTEPFSLQTVHSTLLMLGNKYGGLYVDVRTSVSETLLTISSYKRGQAPVQLINQTRHQMIQYGLHGFGLHGYHGLGSLGWSALVLTGILVQLQNTISNQSKWKMHTMTWKHLVLYMNMVNQTIKH